MPFGPAPTSRLRLSLIAGLSAGAKGLRLTRATGSTLEHGSAVRLAVICGFGDNTARFNK